MEYDIWVSSDNFDFCEVQCFLFIKFVEFSGYFQGNMYGDYSCWLMELIRPVGIFLYVCFCLC